MGPYSLHFIKNKEKQEVDFLIVDENDPVLRIEAKLSDTQPSPALLKFQSSLQVSAVQLNNRPGGFRLISNDTQKLLVAPDWQWLALLPQAKGQGGRGSQKRKAENPMPKTAAT